ncbi:MFS transporter [Thiofilum flexile]|uniref:MFS transporter n=1 Tax=Thiofilum flexile TaxID=125627 RepID=UPI000364563B|nr:MFS transporter [Thiofilum flexile]
MPQARSIYRQPNFLPFLSGRVLAAFATQIQAVVVAWQVYDMTNDPMALAYVGLAQFIPMLLLLIPAGDLLDRFERKKILTASWLLEALCGALLLVLSLIPIHNPIFYYVVLMLYGCGRAFTGPAVQSLLPQIVPREQLAAAIATNSMLMRSAAIAGPLVGGGLYALGGGALTYTLCMLGFSGGALLLTRVNIVAPIKTNTPISGNAWQRFTAGIQFIRSRPIILGTISLDLFAVLLGGVVALLPIYAKDILHVGSLGLGALRSGMSLGEIAVGLYLSLHPLNHHVGKIMFAAVIIFGLANLVFSLSTSFILSFIALMIAGAADMVSVYIRSALVQFSTPDEMRGRVNAVNMLFISSSNELGEFRAGLSAKWLGTEPAAVVGSLFTLGVAGLWMWAFKPLIAVNKFEDASAKA